MDKSGVISPVTENSNCSIKEEFLSDDIVKLYKSHFNLDVDRFFKETSSVIIYECDKTGYRFYHPIKIMGDGLFYEQLQKGGEKDGKGYYRSNTFDHKLSFQRIGKEERVLEIGCGDGSFMKTLINEKNINVTGLELNNYAVKKCQKEGLDVHNVLIEDFAVDHKNTFDTVCSFQVLEHVYAVKSFIKSSIEVLKSGGQLIISVPNSSPYLMRHDKYATLNLPPHHIGLWNRQVFANLTKVFPLELIDVKYSQQTSTKGDAYFRVKKWIGSKAMHNMHSFTEKLLMGLLLPFAYILSTMDNLTGKINGNQICVVFKKK